MEQKLVKVTNKDGVDCGEIIIFPSLGDALDAMFRSAFPSIHIRPFEEFRKEEEAREKIERADDFKAYEIVKNILFSEIDNIQRLHLRLARGNSSVLLDKKVSKSICRFFLRRAKNKYITILNSSCEHEKFIISSLEDINLYVNELKNALNMRLVS